MSPNPGQSRFGSLSHGQPYLAIPGPSVIPDRVQRAMHRGSPNIYDGPLLDLTAGIWPKMRRLAGTSGQIAAYIANGHGTWEAANANLFSRGDTALVLSTGRFGVGWAMHAREMGVNVIFEDFGLNRAADPARLEELLRADREGKIKAVLVTHVDTASSVRNDIPALRAAMDAAGHPALLAVDCIATMGCDEYRMDEWRVDVTVAACQKGLMTPPGLGFVWFNEQARERCGQGDLATPYWRWGPRADAPEFWQHWNGTAPTHHLYGLAEALTMILDEEGLEAVWSRHRRLAGAVWATVEAWAAGNPAIGLNVPQADWRGSAVTSVRFGGAEAKRLRQWTEQEAGVTLGLGLGMDTPEDPQADGWLRIAHMGHVNAHMTLGALAVMDTGLKALKIAHGAGAMEAASRALI